MIIGDRKHIENEDLLDNKELYVTGTFYTDDGYVGEIKLTNIGSNSIARALNEPDLIIIVWDNFARILTQC